MTQNQTLFFQKFGITPADLQKYLGEALSAGGDYADLYFEYLTSTSISVDESIVKSASQGVSAARAALRSPSSCSSSSVRRFRAESSSRRRCNVWRSAARARLASERATKAW